MNRTSDLLVIGGGIVGCSTAYYLAVKGIKVTVLESNIIGNGGSGRNAGGVRQSARDTRELPLAIYAVKNIWPRLSEMLEMDVEYCQGGNLRLGKTDEHRKILKELEKEERKSGLKLRFLSGKEARELCPCISEEVTSATWCPSDGNANPLLATLAFYRKARQMGVRFITGEAAAEIKKYHGKARTVKTISGNVYEAEAIVLAAGYSSREIANTVGIDLPFYKCYDECLVTEAQPPMFTQMLGTADSDFYGRQTLHGSFVFGGLSGLERFHKNESDSTASTSYAVASISRCIMDYIPALAEAKVIRHWAGWLDKCVDGIPVISQVEEVPGLVIAAGFSGHGFGLSPAAGLVASQIVTGEEPVIDISPFRYNRFRARA